MVLKPAVKTVENSATIGYNYLLNYHTLNYHTGVN